VVLVLAATGALLTSKHLMVVEADQLHDLCACLLDFLSAMHHMLDLAKARTNNIVQRLFSLHCDAASFCHLLRFSHSLHLKRDNAWSRRMLE
jgi:hypothetical protein